MAAQLQGPFGDQFGNMADAMQRDVDAHAGGGPALITGAPPDPVVVMQNMMQQMAASMNAMLDAMAIQMQNAPGVGVSPSPPGIPSVGVNGTSSHLANVRLDERSFRRLDKFTNSKSEWREWRMHFLTAVRECDKSFGDSLVKHEKSEVVIKDTALTPTEQQLSATLQARLISLTAKEAFAIVTAAEGQGIEAWRQLTKRYDPQTDARFALLLISLVSFKIGKTQDVQSELVRWEQMLLSLEKDHSEALSRKIRRALLLNILPTGLQSRLLEHLDRLVDYGQVREKVVSLVQMTRSPDAMDTSSVEPWVGSWDDEQSEEPPAAYTEEEEQMDLAALAEVVCHRCNKKGHFARDCRSAPKGGKSKGKSKGTRFMSSYGNGGKGGGGQGSGGQRSGVVCSGCNKTGHRPEGCWTLHPELRPPPRRKAQGVEGEEQQ